MKILVIRRDNIGDLVCTTPLFAGLRARYPRAHIGALVNSYNAPVLEGNPHIDEVHYYTKLKHRLSGQSRFDLLAKRLKMLMRLRRERFDYVLLAKGGFDREGLRLARQLRHGAVVGFAPPGATPPEAITVPVPPPRFDDLHEVEIMAHLGRALDAHDTLGPLRIHSNSSRISYWRACLQGLMRPCKLWVAAHISGREPGRRWPTDRWVELLRVLTASPDVGIVLLWAPGSSDDPRHPGDDEKARCILANTNAVAAPTRELADLIAVLSLCDAFIGADGGAMHVAAAAGLPMVALFENVESKKLRWRPWRIPHELVVAHETCDIAGITVEHVSHAWERLSKSTGFVQRAERPARATIPPQQEAADYQHLVNSTNSNGGSVYPGTGSE